MSFYALRAKHCVMGLLLSSEEQDTRFMVELRARLLNVEMKLYARDLFWEGLQKLRACDNEWDYTDDEWLGALSSLDAFLCKHSFLCFRLGLS